MNNGCICCTVRGDLIKILHKLLRRTDRLDSIIIETTGLADPAPVAQSFFVDEYLQVCTMDESKNSLTMYAGHLPISKCFSCSARQDWMVSLQSLMRSILFSTWMRRSVRELKTSLWSKLHSQTASFSTSWILFLQQRWLL